MAESVYKKRKDRGVTFLLHRYVWEQHNGPIPDGYVVHHRDHNKRNNDISNLQLMTHQEHSEHHNQKYSKTKHCVICEDEFTPDPTKRKRQQTCSPDCATELMRLRAAERIRPALTDVQIVQCQLRVLGGEQRKDLAAEFGVSQQTMGRYIKREMPPLMARAVLREASGL